LLLGTSAGFRSNSWSEELQDSDTASKGEGVLGDNSDVAQRGRDLVIEQLQRRGTSGTEVMDGRTRLIRVTSPRTGRTFMIRPKTRTGGTWQTTITLGTPSEEPEAESSYWVFVDLATRPAEFYIAPDWWVRNDIHHNHQAHLRRHGGHRAKTASSTHHAIQKGRIADWHGRWDLLGLE
jgi:hypothetical protein